MHLLSTEQFRARKRLCHSDLEENKPKSKVNPQTNCGMKNVVVVATTKEGTAMIPVPPPLGIVDHATGFQMDNINVGKKTHKSSGILGRTRNERIKRMPK